jgi:hypothetical protein
MINPFGLSVDQAKIKMTPEKEKQTKKYLGKKTERSNNKIYNKSNNKKQQEEKNTFHLENLNDQNQMKISDFFKNNSNNNSIRANNNIRYLEKIDIKDKNNERYTIYHYNKNIHKNKSKSRKPLVANPFEKFSSLLKEKQKFNTLIEKGIFTELEISKVIEISKEYDKEINNSSIQENDKLIKIINYFLNKGFNEKIRYIIYKCLINYGLPNLEKFNTFYNNVNNALSKKKLNTPEKMCILLYIEYINYFLKNEFNTNSLARNKFISEFFFNKENCQIVKSNLDFINTIKNKSLDNLELYLDNNFENIFKNSRYHLNSVFQKSKAVIIKILCNISLKCEKIGFLNYKKIIDDYDIIFSGLKFKGINLTNNVNFAKIISNKLFSIELTEKKLKNAIEQYFLLLVSNFHSY